MGTRGHGEEIIQLFSLDTGHLLGSGDHPNMGKGKFTFLFGVGAEDENGPRGKIRHAGDFAICDRHIVLISLLFYAMTPKYPQFVLASARNCAAARFRPREPRPCARQDRGSIRAGAEKLTHSPRCGGVKIWHFTCKAIDIVCVCLYLCAIYITEHIKMVKKAALSVRINESTKAAVEKAAAKDRRSVSSLVEIILADATQAQKTGRPKKYPDLDEQLSAGGNEFEAADEAYAEAEKRLQAQPKKLTRKGGR